MRTSTHASIFVLLLVMRLRSQVFGKHFFCEGKRTLIVFPEILLSDLSLVLSDGASWVRPNFLIRRAVSFYLQ